MEKRENALMLKTNAATDIYLFGYCSTFMQGKVQTQRGIINFKQNLAWS